MKEKKQSMLDVLQRLAEVEIELSKIRQQIAQEMNETAHKEDGRREYNVTYTLDDLYKAFGSKQHYATRLKHALQQKGINNLTEFLAMTPGELLELDNVSVGTLQKTKKALERLGICW